MILLDTHALVWWVAEPARLSVRARRAILAAASDRRLCASAASVLEIATLLRRGRLTLSAEPAQWLDDLRALPELRIESVGFEVAARAGSFDGPVHGDPIDRLLIATAMLLHAPLVTADVRLRELRMIRTIW